MVAEAAHIFVQVRLLQIHNLELQPLEDLFQGLAGLVVELLTWEEMARRVCVSSPLCAVGGWLQEGAPGHGMEEGTLPPAPLSGPAPAPAKLFW